MLAPRGIWIPILAAGLATTACARETGPAAVQEPSSFGDPSATPTDPQPPMPDRFVIVNEDEGNRVELRSTADGALLEVLSPTAHFGGLSVSAASGTVFFSRSEPMACDPTFHGFRTYSVPVTGGEVVALEWGHSPAVSPDGRWLAYTQGGAPCDGASLVVRDLQTGDEREWAAVPWRWAYGDEGAPAHVHSTRWAQDSRSFVYGITTGDPGFATFVMERSEGDDVLDGSRIDASDDAGEPHFYPTFGATRSEVYALRQFHHDVPRPDRLVRMDGSGVEKVRRFDVLAAGFDVDGSGSYFLVSGRALDDHDPVTLVWDGAGEPVRIGDFAGAVAWVD